MATESGRNGNEANVAKHARMHAHTQSLYSSLDFVRDNPRQLIPEATFRHLLDFLMQNEDNSNTGRDTNNPDGLPPQPD